jgi:hypothetical protein
VDVSLNSTGEADFAPAARLARDLGNDRYLGLEYYADFGKIGDFSPWNNRANNCSLLRTSK